MVVLFDEGTQSSRAADARVLEGARIFHDLEGTVETFLAVRLVGDVINRERLRSHPRITISHPWDYYLTSSRLLYHILPHIA